MKPEFLCEPSQKGLLLESPQRQMDTLGFSMISFVPSGLRTMYEPFVSMPNEPSSRKISFMPGA